MDSHHNGPSGTASVRVRSRSVVGMNDGWSTIHSQFLTPDEGLSGASTPIKETSSFLGPASPSSEAYGSTGGSFFLLVSLSILLSPLRYARHVYRFGSRYLVFGGRRLRRVFDQVLPRASRQYQLIPTSPTPSTSTQKGGKSPAFLLFCTFVCIIITYPIWDGILHPATVEYIQGQTYPVNASDPKHYMVYHLEGLNADLELTPYREDQRDIFRINLTHPDIPPVTLYKHISILKAGFEGKTYIYQSVPLNNTKVVFKHFFAMTRSQPVPREIRSKVLSESRALNRLITGDSDWTSGMSILTEEGNLWGWAPKGDAKMLQQERMWRDKQMEWPIEVAASVRKWASFREVMKRLSKEMNITEEKPKRIEKWSIEEEQEEGELIKLLDVFYLPDLEIAEMGDKMKSNEKPIGGKSNRKRAQPKKSAEELAKEKRLEAEALSGAAKLVGEMKSEELAEREGTLENNSPEHTPTSTTQNEVPKQILRNSYSDIESWGIVLPFLEGGDADHLLPILPLLGLSPADLDWLYRPLFARGVLKALARMHHTKEDQHDRDQFRWVAVNGIWYSDWGLSEFTHEDTKEHIGTHGIPRVRRPQRVGDYAQGYCHGDVKLDNIFIRKVAAEEKATIESVIAEAEPAPHDFRRPEDYMELMKTEKASPTLQPPRGPRHYFVLSDLSQTRPLHNQFHIRNGWRDCRLIDTDRAWRSYLQLLRMGSRTRRDRNGGESPTKRFDEVFLKWREAFVAGNGLMPFQPEGVLKITPMVSLDKRSQKRSHSEDPEAYISAYFSWLANPQIPSALFLPQTNITDAQQAHGIFASDYWTRDLPLTRRISIMGSQVREMSRSQVFSVIDGMRGEVDKIKEMKKTGRPVSIPSWYYEFGGEGKTRPGGGDGHEELTKEEKLVEEGTKVVQAIMMGM